jgi:catechol 2,3-dioxygenase-like lactoylglutathione lyase family enzyme
VGELPDYPAVFLSDNTVMITLWQATEPERAVPFDRHHNVGLHHVAFTVGDIDAVYQRLVSRNDVNIEFAPEALHDGPTRHLMCTVPGGIRVEFIAPHVT